MKKRYWLILITTILVIVFMVPVVAMAGSEDEPDPNNKVHLDIVIDPSTNTMDAGGFSHQELALLLGQGVPEVVAETVGFYTALLNHLQFRYGGGSMHLDTLLIFL